VNWGSGGTTNTNYIFVDEFDRPDGPIGNGWDDSYGCGTFSITNGQLKLNDPDCVGDPTAWHSINTTNSVIVLESKIKIESGSAEEFRITLLNTNDYQMAIIELKQGTFWGVNGTNTNIWQDTGTNYNIGQLYNVKIVANQNLKKYNVFVDDKKVIDEWAFRTNFPQIIKKASVSAQGFGSSGVYYVDYIKVYKTNWVTGDTTPPSEEQPPKYDEPEVEIEDDFVQPGEEEKFDLGINLNKGGTVTIEVYDIQGNLVYTICRDKQFDRGYHNIRWEVKKALGSGVYWVVMKGEGWTKRKRVAIIK